MSIPEQIDNSPATRLAVGLLCVALLLGGGWYCARLGVVALRTGEFPNQRTGQALTGPGARALAAFFLSLGLASMATGLGVLVILFR